MAEPPGSDATDLEIHVTDIVNEIEGGLRS